MKLFQKILLSVFVAALVALVQAVPAKAYSNENMIDNAVFDAKDAMSEAQIRAFIQARPNTCLTRVGVGFGGGNVFDEPIDYFTYSTNKVDAARIIYIASQYNGVNPRVILSTLQKEQGFFTDNDCIDNDGFDRLNKAMGTGCFEGARDANGNIICPDPAYAGFSRQVMKGTWQLAHDRHRSEGDLTWGNPSRSYAGFMVEGFRRRCGTDACPLVYYDGYGIIDGVATRINNGATAALYNYTPHRNQSFPYWFELFFGAGSTTAPSYDYQLYSSTQSVHWLNPGQVVTYNSIVIQNTGTLTWYPDGNVPPGARAIRLAQKNYIPTPFADTSDAAWLGTSNQIKVTDPQVSIPPGEYARFTFRLKAPYQDLAYINRFVPVIDGVGFMADKGMQYNTFTYPPSYQHVSHVSPPPVLLPNQKADVNVVLKNTGNAPWYADGAVPPGARPMRIASLGYMPNSLANIYDPAWLGTRSQVKMTPAQVNPGENATFTFSYLGPFSAQSNSFRFTPVIDGYRALTDYGMAFSTSSPALNSAYQFVSAINPPTVMSPGSIANVQLSLRNTGNVIWRNEANRIGPGSLRLGMVKPFYRTSAFYSSADTNWLSSSQIGLTTPTVSPGEVGVFNFQWKAPTTTGTYTEWFAPVIDGVQWMQDVGMGFRVTVQ